MFLLQHYPESLYNRYYNANGELVEEEGTATLDIACTMCTVQFSITWAFR